MRGKYVFIFIFLITMFYANLGHCGTISVSAFTSPDDVTVTHLETQRVTFQNAINSADGALIQSGTITKSQLDANTNPENRWDEAFDDFVFTGLLPPTSSNLSSTTTSGTAYIKGARVVKDATSNTYTASKWTYVDLSNTGTYTYAETAIGAAEPSVTSNSIRLARVSTDSSTVLSVVDSRTLNMGFPISPKIGIFTRDTTTGNGTQAITGLGFKPKIVIAFSVQNSSAESSWGFDDGSSPRALIDNNGASTDTYTSSSFLISLYESASLTYEGKITSLDPDGFTITWTRGGATSGTITINYLAFPR